MEVNKTTLHVYDHRNHLIKNASRTRRKEIRQPI
jgi:hypothetical protein